MNSTIKQKNAVTQRKNTATQRIVPSHRIIKQHRTHNTEYIKYQSRSGKEIMCQVVQKKKIKLN